MRDAVKEEESMDVPRVSLNESRECHVSIVEWHS